MTTSNDHEGVEFAELSLRERIPDYIAVFATGLGAAIVVSVLATLFGPTFRNSFGNVLISYTAILFLMGGTSGGGYTNMGLGTLLASVGRRGSRSETLDERLQRGLRPQKNPRAFWQVIAGGAYLAIAITVFSLG